MRKIAALLIVLGSLCLAFMWWLSPRFNARNEKPNVELDSAVEDTIKILVYDELIRDAGLTNAKAIEIHEGSASTRRLLNQRYGGQSKIIIRDNETTDINAQSNERSTRISVKLTKMGDNDAEALGGWNISPVSGASYLFRVGKSDGSWIIKSRDLRTLQ